MKWTFLPVAAALVLVLLGSPATQAADRWWGGGGLGFSFNSDIRTLSVEPIVGYRAMPKFGLGLRFVLRFRDDRRFEETYSTTDYGAALFGRYWPTEKVFLHVEYEYLNYEYLQFGGATDREGFDSLLGGAGFSQRMNKNSNFFVMGLYNFSYDSNVRSPYSQPWVVRVGFGFFF